MKKSNIFIALILGLVLMSCSRVDPGYVGVKVKVLGQNKGVQPVVLETGRYWMGRLYELYTYPTYMNIYPFTLAPTEGSESDEALRFQSIEGITCNVDIAVSCHADPAKAATVFVTFKKEMIDIIKLYVRQDLSNYLIDYASKLRVDQLYSVEKMDMLNFAKAELTKKYAISGIIIDDLSYKSDIRFPQAVQDAIIAKIEAIQLATQKQNEIVQAEADAKKAVAKAEGEAQSLLRVAEAQAKANNLLSNSITATLVNYELAKKWNGTSPTYSGNGSVLPPLFK
jgi:regulator of protease activity HflC (stomatin/prohibitin superfamily)